MATRPLGKALLLLAAVVTLAALGRPVTAGGVVPPAAAAIVSAAPSMDPSAESAISPPRGTSVDAGEPPPQPVPHEVVAAAHSAHATAEDPVYLNDASIEELRRLPGIGEKRALAILELRGKLGRFRQVDDLLRVKGIGRTSLRRLRPLVRLDARDGGR